MLGICRRHCRYHEGFTEGSCKCGGGGGRHLLAQPGHLLLSMAYSPLAPAVCCCSLCLLREPQLSLPADGTCSRRRWGGRASAVAAGGGRHLLAQPEGETGHPLLSMAYSPLAPAICCALCLLRKPQLSILAGGTCSHSPRERPDTLCFLWLILPSLPQFAVLYASLYWRMAPARTARGRGRTPSAFYGSFSPRSRNLLCSMPLSFGGWHLLAQPEGEAGHPLLSMTHSPLAPAICCALFLLRKPQLSILAGGTCSHSPRERPDTRCQTAGSDPEPMCVWTRAGWRSYSEIKACTSGMSSCQMPKEEDGPPTLVLPVPPEPRPGLKRRPSWSVRSPCLSWGEVG
jgi:hypothetical protein